MRQNGLAGLTLALLLTACVDTASLKGFECDEAGQCVPPKGQTAGGSGGGGATGGGGGSVDPDGGGGAGGGGGAASCDPSSCTGCCDGTTCVGGDVTTACGTGGNACVDCGSGQRCVNGACEPLKSNGGTCAQHGECLSGFCAGNVCCSSACSGPCETCSAAGSEGRCTPLVEATNAAACGDFACDGVNGSCPTRCTTPRQCATGRYCDANGSCVALKANGLSCQSSPECTSGFCADGVCCNSACTGSCDRCNLANLGGTCSPAAASDPGSPACGGSVVCNGTLADCPIPCGSGCPANTYCGGMYCAAKKPLGAPCGAATECTSSFCADGVCCNTACGGACDACSVAAGALVNGTCALLGTSRVCRAAANSCDVEERCTGSSPDCPANAFAMSGASCGQTTYGAWSTCTAAMACVTSGTQTRTRTDQACNGTGACAPAAATESQACTRMTDGTSCGTTTYSAWTTCAYADGCASSGSRTRMRTDAVCGNGTCMAVQTTETDTAGCARNTNGTSCGTATTGSWSTCSYAGQCSESGTRTRPRTDQLCQSGACTPVMTTETDTSGCSRMTSGQSCGTTMTGAWGTCSYSATCSTNGTRTRQVSTYTCGSSMCNTSTTTETDTTTCTRTTSGQQCGTTQYGAWSACSYANGCSNSGSRTRTVTTYNCNGSGSCAPSTSTETDTAGCGRNQDGQTCGATQYGGWSACSYGDTCTNTGSRTRPVTTYTCGGGSCNAGSGTETDTSGCGRNTNGVSCGADQCGACVCFYPDCTRYRDCTVFTCSSGTCQGVLEPQWQVCGACGGGCIPQ